jgi:hypothetical protein
MDFTPVSLVLLLGSPNYLHHLCLQIWSRKQPLLCAKSTNGRLRIPEGETRFRD